MANVSERRRVDERRTQLVDAAITVLARDGLAGSTTRQITREAGLALGAFHYAFVSKSDLLRAVIERYADNIADVLRSTITTEIDDLTVFARHVLEGYWSVIEDTPNLQLAQYELTVYALRQPELRDLADLQYQRLADAVEQVLDHVPTISPGQQRTDFARFITATMDGLVLQYLIEGDKAAARRRLDLYVHTMPALADLAE
ncbi:MAG: TetR/AcrR family transcriptional regulator [Nitriliruptoraceae bacterium]